MNKKQSGSPDRTRRILKILLRVLLVIAGLWLVLEIGVRYYVESPLDADFYGSIPRDLVRQRQEQYQVQVASGPGWAHLGWVADPEREEYRIERLVNGAWQETAKVVFGSYLLKDEGGSFRVWAVPKGDDEPRLIGEVEAVPGEGSVPPVYKPRITGSWQTLFRPKVHGYYINDHTVYQDGAGDWRLVGITDKSDGNYDEEKYFAVGVSAEFPPPDGMVEDTPVADFGELAWAPHVLVEGSAYHMFWSPHKLHQMTSTDGITWENHQVTMPAPYHKFFRDPMVIKVAENQWLLYTTARGRYYSLVDIYQSFDLQEWQYIRTALHSGWGSERNSPFASTESPSVTLYEGRYYLTMTYNNDSFFWPGVLMLFRIWTDLDSYNDTLVLHSDNPYDFGTYRGKNNTPALLTQLEAHGPELVHNLDTDRWYITTAGWPWVATLTSGEVGVAPLAWERVP